MTSLREKFGSLRSFARKFAIKFGSFARKYRNELGLILAIVVVVSVTFVLDPTDAYWLKPGYNAKEILRHASILGIFALGAGIVIIVGGIDLSSGSVIALSGAVCASFIIALVPIDESGNPITKDIASWILLAAFLGTLVVAFMVGSFHAWLVTVLRLPPFIATLASLVGLRSLARVLVQDVNGAFSNNRNTEIYIDDEFFISLGMTWWIPLIIFLVIAFGLWVLMSRTVIGRHLYAVGGNEEAARLSGIRTDRIKWLAYTIGTLTAAVAGILYTCYIGSSTPESQGVGYELNAIAAAVVGGCSLAGGIGSIQGILLGALFLRVVIDAVAKTVKNNPDEFQGLILGMLIVLAVTFNELRASGGFRRKFFSGALGLVNIVVLTILAGTISLVMASENKIFSGVTVASVVLTVLVIRKFFEMRSRTQ